MSRTNSGINRATVIAALLFYTAMLSLKQLCDFTMAENLTHNFDMSYYYLLNKSVHRLSCDLNPGSPVY